MRIRVPLWLRWFLGLGLLSVLGLTSELLGNVDLAVGLLSWFLFLLLVQFPGPDPRRPRYFVLVTVIWVVVTPVVAVTLVNDRAWALLAGPYIPRWAFGTARLLVAPYVLLLPALVYTLWNRRRAFPVLLLLCLAYNLVLTILGFVHLPAQREPDAATATLLQSLLDVVSTAYLVVTFRAIKRRDAGMAAPTGPEPPYQPAR